MTPSAGLYVHLPYCASRCGYCAFVVTTDGASRDRYLRALEREAALLGAEAEGARFDAVYLGGGTPSLLPPSAVALLLAGLRLRFGIAADSEVTLEANPEDVSGEALAAWRDAGVNRVSLGVQSFADRELSAVGRRHDARRAADALEALVRGGVRVSGDLILGLPLQTPESFAASLARLFDSGAAHVSVYLLETEKSRALEEDRRAHPERYLADDAQADVWLEAGAALAERGFVHYEISNWALPGSEARHNVKYWTRTPTLGLGVSAHELWAGRRRANVAQLETYLGRVEAGRRPLALDERVSDEAAEREEVFLGLRLGEGVPEEAIGKILGNGADPRLAEDYAGWFETGILSRADGRVRFTERGFLVSNEVLSRFV
jgi:oxygen-independent coproporphyrinogen-3 oxidase